MDSDDIDYLIDQIYAAPFTAGAWSDVVARVGTTLGATSFARLNINSQAELVSRITAPALGVRL